MGSRTDGRHADRQPPRIVAAPFALTVIVAPELLGGALGWSISAIALLSLATLIAAAFHYRGTTRFAESGGLALGVLALTGWTLLAAVPLPCGLVRRLSPAAARHAEEIAAALGGAARCTLSYDPGNTLNETVKLAAVGALVLTGWLLARSGHRRFVLACAAASGGVMAVVALAHGAMQLDAVFGAYVPKYVERRLLLAPIVNGNQLGGFLTLTLPAALVLAVKATGSLERATWWSAAFVMALATTLTLSRGAYASLFVGTALLAFLLLRHRKRQKHAPLRTQHRLVSGLGVLAIAGGIAAGVFAANDSVSEELGSGGLSKLELAAQGLRLGLDHPYVGVGRGGFSSAFVRVRGDTKRYVYPENFVAEWASEWGVIVALGLLLVLAVALGRAAWTTPSRTRIAAIACIVAVLVHDLFDFTLELLGPAVVAGALLGAALAPSGREPTTPPRLFTTFPRAGVTLAWSFVVAGALLLGLLSASVPSRDVNALQATLERNFTSGERDAFRTTLERAVRLHPAEPVFALLGGAEAARHGDPRAGLWLVRAMRLAPEWAAPHIEAARALFATGRRDQALLDIREAVRRDLPHARGTLCTFIGELGNLEAVERAAPDGPARFTYLDAVARCEGLPLELTHDIDVEILKSPNPHPAQRDARMREARRATFLKHPEEAVALLKPAAIASPTDVDMQAAYARALLAAKLSTDADAVVARALRTNPDAPELLRMHARTRAALNDREGMLTAISALRGRTGVHGEALAETMVLLADLEQQLGNRHQALVALEEANSYNATPDTVARIAR
ncbi:MAG: O-antigen ligase family protein, partial [Myxococcales bacterium]|nr:O-antigen ligase family protein [Myxococcales bacterium]